MSRETDATGLAALVRKKEISPLELVEQAIARIEKLNPELNAVITPMYDAARAAARAPLPDGPFTGVPFLVKDLFTGVAGVRLTNGSAFTRDFVARHDSELVARHRRAGLVLVGKTNTPEFGLPPTTEPTLTGKTRNPWNPAHTPGGSSGGSAAAVASGMVPMAHAGDGGGSIRIPASCCGIFGMKPTRGRNPLGPDVGDMMHGLVVEHAVTRSVRDSAALLDATCGMDLGAPYDAPARARPYRDEAGTPPGRLRIRFTATAPDTAVHPDCVAAVGDAAKLCATLGHDVEQGSLALPGWDLVVRSFVALWSGGALASVDGWSHVLGREPQPGEIEPLTQALWQMGRALPLSRYLKAVAHLQQVSRRIQEKWQDVDVWLTPTTAEPPPPLGTFDPAPDNALAGFARASAFVPFTPIVNVTGQPAMSVPLYWNAEGLPIGTHFIGRFGDEATLFRLAAQLEAARPWAGRKPPISA